MEKFLGKNTQMRVLVDGATAEPRLSHPEGIAVDREGNIWCGGDRGEIYRMDPDGGNREIVASTDGFCLGMAFDRHGDLFVCDMKYAAVFKLEVKTGALSLFSEGVEGHRFQVPNYPAFDARGRLFVSDSWHFADPGPGIIVIEPDGTGSVWHAGPFTFANGIAFSPDGSMLYVAETFRNTIAAIEVREDGSAGGIRDLAVLPGILPDGLAVAEDGSVLVGCYEPSRILHVTVDGDVTILVDDPTAHTLAHPTNLAFQGDQLLACNLGRWHITTIDVNLRGVSLPLR